MVVGKRGYGDLEPLNLWELSQISTTLVILQSLVQEHARRSRDRDQSEVEVGFCDPCNREIPSSSDVIFWKSLGYILVRAVFGSKVIDYQAFCEIRKVWAE